MVDPISRRIARIQNDFKKVAPHGISEAEADGLIRRAKNDGLTQSEVTTLQNEFKRYESSFTPGAKSKMTDFLASAYKSTQFDVQSHQPGLLADPAPLKADQKLLNQKVVAGGQLFIGDVRGSDAEQQYLGDCYLMAAMSAVAHASPKTIREAFKQNDDGTYSVRLFSKQGGSLVPTWVRVDADLPHDVKGRLSYARGHDPKELWPALLEKAFAAKAGGYAKIEAGIPGDALSWLTGKATTDLEMKKLTPDAIFKAISEAAKAGKPMTAATKADSAGAEYTNTGIYTDHTYTIWGTSVEKGERYVQLRNPWGSSEPEGNGADDGVFKLPLKRFLELFPDVAING